MTDNITITMTISVPTFPAALSLLQRFLLDLEQLKARDQQSIAVAPATDVHPAAGKKRGRPSSTTLPMNELQPELVEREQVAPPTGLSPSGMSLVDMRALLKETVDAIGFDAARTVIAKFKATKLSEVQQKDYPALARALAEARKVTE